MTDSYKTAARDARVEMKVLGSRFIATVRPIAAKDAAMAFIETVRREFHDATHNCYAYRLGNRRDEFRYSDDGEPSGTAGKPILAAIDHLDLTDVAVVVTRYFGGTKLGTGGLARTYGEAAALALSKAGHETRFVTEIISADFPHAYIGNVMHIISSHQAKILDTMYDEEVHLTIEIHQSHLEDFRTSLVNATAGNIVLKSGAKP